MSDFKPLTDAERLEKLEQAIALIRDVEFSYPFVNDEGQRDETRRMIYSVIVDSFSLTKIGALYSNLRKKVRGY